MRPKEYDGKESINSFLSHFNVCAEFNNWTSSEKKAWLQWALKDRARQVLWDGPAGETQTFDDLATALRQRFGSDHQQEIHKIELDNRRRRPNESLSELMQDVRRLMVLGYPSEQGSMWESVAISAFLNALNDPHLALEVRKRSPASLDGAYRDAMLLDGYYKASNGEKVNEKGRPNHVRSARAGDSSEQNRQDRTVQRELLETMQQMQQFFHQQAQQQQLGQSAVANSQSYPALVPTHGTRMNTGEPNAMNNQPGRPPLAQRQECRGRGRGDVICYCLLYTSPSPRDGLLSRMPSSA